MRHSLAEIFLEREIQDPDLAGVPVTLTEVRMSPDLKHATCFVEPLGGEGADKVTAALNRAARFLRGRLGRMIELKYTPELRFVHDESFGAAAEIDAIFARPDVARDLASGAAGAGEDEDA